MAVNCWVSPSGIDGLAGVTAIDSSSAAVTVRVADSPLSPLLIPLAESVAEMVVEPIATLVARPSELTALLMVATAVALELQVTEVVIFWVELSL